MRILAIAESVDKKSGWGRCTYSITTELEQRGYSVHTETFVLEKKTTPFLLSSAIRLSKKLFLLRRMAREAEVVHAFDVWPFAVYGYIAVLGTSRPLFITGVGTYSVPPVGSSFKRFLIGLALKRAKKIMCISDYTRKRILESMKLNNVVTVYLGTSPLPSLDGVEIEKRYRSYQIKKTSHPILLTIGQIKHRKGQYDTVKAVRILKKKYPHILYIMIGSSKDGEYVSRIKQFVELNDLNENIIIFDEIDNDLELSFFYTIADIFALNSNNHRGVFEGFGLVLLEAESFAKPVIGSRNCGIEEAFQDKINGYLTEQQNEEDIAKKIDMILEGDREKMQQASYEFQSGFTWKKTIDQYINFYNQP